MTSPTKPLRTYLPIVRWFRTTLLGSLTVAGAVELATGSVQAEENEMSSTARTRGEATYPDAVHATDIITRWSTGGKVVQTFNTVDIYSNDTYSSSHATKTSRAGW